MAIEGSKSLPSSFGHVTEKLFDEYPIYKFNLPSTLVNTYLPLKLKSFSSSTWKNASKRHFFYSKPIIYASRCQISKTTEQLSSQISLTDLLQELFIENNSKIRYNFVITGNYLIFARIPRHYHVTYHILCKHITLANRSIDVRFAGELWKDEQDHFHLNNNSGTYRPQNRLIPQAIQLFDQLTPSLQFKGMHFQKNMQFPVKHRLNNKIQPQ
ncbi:unnamed protein product [Adineta steineri]|uniref:Uncharacterized protein n=1 Tax=Adineta steineri TaxID=433720 RepID=A0A814XFZ2_9BILA|nr:unnamed protein product [Adineta steineri]CAF1238316.1 unnamed protein product [Adineta steineri]CAF1290555.1 unnamed protein product [Adineta steineri]CAF3964603.1 unnamed protein product [Adineta steineri]CAF4070690.1 unnamed protein product [Adineta steineri]